MTVVSVVIRLPGLRIRLRTGIGILTALRSLRTKAAGPLISIAQHRLVAKRAEMVLSPQAEIRVPELGTPKLFR